MAITSEYREQENIAYFDRWAKTYDTGRISQWFQYTQSLAINALAPTEDSNVLDLGCGTGAAVLQLGQFLVEGRACGVDISEEMVRQASAKIPEELIARVEFRQGSSDAIPYADETFDGIICTNSFHHYPDPVQALQEMQRVLKDNGQIVVLDNAPDLSWYTWLWDKILRVIETGHIRYYPSQELGGFFREAGLKNVKLRYLQNERFKYGKLFASLQVWSGHKPDTILGTVKGR